MSAMEIVLLVLGLAAFIISFFIPDRKKKSDSEIQFSEEQIKELVQNEIKNVKSKIEDVADETVTYVIEKTERSLERLTNEKIKAVSEYSDTVLDDINKSHKEVLFLYDMLNDKQEAIHETVKKVSETTAETENTMKKIMEKTFTPGIQAQAEKENTNLKTAQVQVETVPETVSPIKGKKTAKPKQKTTSMTKEIHFEGIHADDKNNNEQILELHNQGKSNMVIAKELGLGVGEVKLVIDLFKGI